MTYTLKNTTQQGLNITYVVSSTIYGTLIGSGKIVSFEADSLTPSTESMIESGYLISASLSASIQAPQEASYPVIHSGVFRSDRLYRKGEVVTEGTTYYILKVGRSLGETPSISTDVWDVLGGPSTGTLQSHIEDTNNPHSVTAAQVSAVPLSQKGAASGVATLDGSGLLPLAQLPDLSGVALIASLSAASHTRNEDAYLDFGGANQVAASAIKSHLTNVSNPHSVTAAQVGAVATSTRGVANGVATLDASALVPTAQLTRAIVVVTTVGSIAARNALTPKQGDICKVTDIGDGTAATYVYSGSSWVQIVSAASVVSVNGQTGSVTLSTTHIAEGTNLYYTDARVNANANVAANSAARHSQNTDTVLDQGNPNEVSASQLRTHLNNTSNPHNVTAGQIGAITSLLEDVTPELGGHMDARGYNLYGLPTPTVSTHAATKGYCDSTFITKSAPFSTKNSNYQLTTTDNATLIRFTATANCFLPNGLGLGFQAVIANVGLGVVTLVAAGTLQSRGTQLTIRYSSCIVTHIGGNVWEVYGELD